MNNTKSLLITTAMPSPDLSPNARVHWRVRHNAAQYLKSRTANETRHAISEAGGVEGLPWHAVILQLTYFCKSKRRRDSDNYTALAKYAIDGLVSGGLLVDDDLLTLRPVKFEIDRKNPRLEMGVSLEHNQDQGWISVDDDLPTADCSILAYCESGYLFINYKLRDAAGAKQLFTHWMPLPEPPKE